MYDYGYGVVERSVVHIKYWMHQSHSVFGCWERDGFI